MHDLSAVAREREVLSAVADAIAAATVGRSLRVAVTCPDSHLTFVGQLTRALHARGLACRCVVSKPNPSVAGLPSESGEPESTLAVITSDPFAQTDADVQRVNIDVTAGASPAPRRVAGHGQAGDGTPDADKQPDVVLEYHEPARLILRHMAPHLSRAVAG
ncbi:hypothetical protein [Micromonospora sp. NPDC023814]|uniref:hypothetical protein n=1 Tax=Micromonospora sp. NPDC023814 TaxID=3154596 RepID=UPI0033C02B40